MIIESKGKRYGECSISFIFKNEILNFNSSNTKDLFKDVIDWLYKTGYDFKGPIHTGTSTKILTEKEVNDIVAKTSYEKRMFYNILNSGKYIAFNSKVKQLFGFLTNMLVSFGVEEDSIKYVGLGIGQLRIKKFGELNKEDEDEEPGETMTSQNPFKQSICVLGESGAGKSFLIEKLLQGKHEFEFIIPTATTTGLLSQFSPSYINPETRSKGGYLPSRLSKMLIQAAENHNKLYTAVFDECHKSNVIEMINDELLQAISKRRNLGNRFISMDDDTATIFENSQLKKDEAGNYQIPDNFGFIFISSKPKIILSNQDFFNRVDIVVLGKFDTREEINTIDDLLKLKKTETKEKILALQNLQY